MALCHTLSCCDSGTDSVLRSHALKEKQQPCLFRLNTNHWPGPASTCKTELESQDHLVETRQTICIPDDPSGYGEIAVSYLSVDNLTLPSSSIDAILSHSPSELGIIGSLLLRLAKSSSSNVSNHFDRVAMIISLSTVGAVPLCVIGCCRSSISPSCFHLQCSSPKHLLTIEIPQLMPLATSITSHRSRIQSFQSTLHPLGTDELLGLDIIHSFLVFRSASTCGTVNRLKGWNIPEPYPQSNPPTQPIHSPTQRSIRVCRNTEVVWLGLHR